jgi:hypothetical protein
VPARRERVQNHFGAGAEMTVDAGGPVHGLY